MTYPPTNYFKYIPNLLVFYNKYILILYELIVLFYVESEIHQGWMFNFATYIETEKYKENLVVFTSKLY